MANTTLLKLDNTLPLGNIDAYMTRVQQIPLLTAEQEHDLAVRLQEDNDLDAARQLVMAHLRYVVRVARGYSGYGLAVGDLIQEGNVGLMKAIRRFDPSMGVRLVSFAVHWIKSEIHEFIIRNWRIVKVATTKAQRKLFFNLRKMKSRLGWFTQEEVAAVAKDLGVTCNDVLTMESRLNNMPDTPFDGPDNDEDHAYLAPAHTLQSADGDPADIIAEQQTGQLAQENLRHALQNLDQRSLDIVQQRWLGEQKATLHDLAEKYNVSAERIRQLEQRALEKMRHAMDEPLLSY